MIQKPHRPRLTEALIAGLVVNGRDRIVFDSLQPGFGIRVTPAGTRIFVAQARVAGRPRRVALGLFPDRSVSDARADARTALADLRAGRDPSVEKASRVKAHLAGQMTVREFAERWFHEYVEAKLKPLTIRDYRRLLDQKINPALGHLIVSRVAKDDVLRFHSDMRAIPRRANYAVAVFRSLMTYAEDVGLRPPSSNPSRRIRLYREKLRERFLSEVEMVKAAEAITATERAGKIGPHAAAGLRLAMFTGARSGEILAAQWDQVDWTRRIIRLPDSKTNEPRTIHLSDAAIAVLKSVPRVGVFVVAGAKKDEAYKSLTNAWRECRDAAGLSDVRLHDLRHSYASLAASRGVSLQMIGKLLSHKVPSTTQRYAHLARDAVSAVNDEIGEAMVAAIAKDKPVSANVVKLTPAKGRAR